MRFCWAGEEIVSVPTEMGGEVGSGVAGSPQHVLQCMQAGANVVHTPSAHTVRHRGPRPAGVRVLGEAAARCRPALRIRAPEAALTRPGSSPAPSAKPRGCCSGGRLHPPVPVAPRPIPAMAGRPGPGRVATLGTGGSASEWGGAVSMSGGPSCVRG